MNDVEDANLDDIPDLIFGTFRALAHLRETNVAGIKEQMLKMKQGHHVRGGCRREISNSTLISDCHKLVKLGWATERMVVSPQNGCKQWLFKVVWKTVVIDKQNKEDSDILFNQ